MQHSKRVASDNAETYCKIYNSAPVSNAALHLGRCGRRAPQKPGTYFYLLYWYKSKNTDAAHLQKKSESASAHSSSSTISHTGKGYREERGLRSGGDVVSQGGVAGAKPAKSRVLPSCVGAGKRANSHELNAIGVAHQQQQQLELAEACYRAALAKKPDFVTALFNLGTLRQAQNDDRGAIAIFGEVLSIQPSYASAHYNIGSAYYRLNQQRQVRY